MDPWLILNFKDKNIIDEIESIPLEKLKKELKIIHESISEIKKEKDNITGLYFENKLNRLKTENPGEYERFHRSVIPLILGTNNKIENILKNSEELPPRITEFLEKNKVELEHDSKIIRKKYPE